MYICLNYEQTLFTKCLVHEHNELCVVRLCSWFLVPMKTRQYIGLTFIDDELAANIVSYNVYGVNIKLRFLMRIVDSIVDRLKQG